MNGFNFDYERLAKEMLKHFPKSYSSPMLSEFTEQIISYTENNRAKKTYEGVKLVCKKLLNYFPPNRRLDTIQLKDAENFLDTIKTGAPKGIYNYHRTSRSMWNKAKQWNYVKSNPFEQVKLKKRQLQKPIYVTEQQLYEIVNHINSDIVKDVVITAFYSGCRLGEIINLTWQDVNLKDDLISIGNKDYESKNRKQRIIPVHQRVREILLKRLPKIIKRDKHYLFCKSSGFPLTGDYFSRRFKRACRQAGLSEDLHFHSLRHGSITRMIMQGSPLPVVQKIAGHAQISTLMIYTHPDLESLREAVSKL